MDFTPLPTYDYQFNTFYLVFSLFILGMLFVCAFVMYVFLTHVNFLREKETRMREMLKVMGVDPGSVTFSW